MNLFNGRMNLKENVINLATKVFDPTKSGKKVEVAGERVSYDSDLDKSLHGKYLVTISVDQHPVMMSAKHDWRNAYMVIAEELKNKIAVQAAGG